MINLNEAIIQIKAAGSANVRAVPEPGQGFEGRYRIEINKYGVWTPIAIGLTKKIAEDVITQALNRTICG